MPVKLGTKLVPDNEARIEIIPLIDIMFFLLASFMAVSLSMVNLKRVPVNLPTATTAETELKRDLFSVTVDRPGAFYLDKTPVGPAELSSTLAKRFKENPQLRVIISGDKDSRHGDMVRALDAIRAAGVQNISIQIQTADGAAQP